MEIFSVFCLWVLTLMFFSAPIYSIAKSLEAIAQKKGE